MSIPSRDDKKRYEPWVTGGGAAKQTSGSGSITVKEGDGSPTVVGVTTIVVSNGSLTDDGGGQVTFTPAGTGDVVGPASSVNNNVVFFDGVTGKLIKDSGLTLSGSNTGDQTITLTGDVTGSGTGTFATTIANDAVTTAKIINDAVTYAKIQNVTTNRLLGRSTAGSGDVEEITIGTGLSLSGGILSATGTGNPFDDGTAIIKGSADATKLLRFEVDGFTTATTRVLTPQNSDYIVAGTNIAQTFIAQQIINTSNAAAFSVGPNGDTNPALRVVTNVGSAATGLSITGNAAGSGVTLTALSSGSNESIIYSPKGTGINQFTKNLLLNSGSAATDNTINIGSTSAGSVNASFSIFVGGVGSTNSSEAPYFLMRGNSFSAIAGQRGTVFLLAGSPSSPTVNEGTIRFFTSNPETERLQVTRGGDVNIVSGLLGFGSATAPDLALARLAVGVFRITNGSTGTGSLIIGPSTASIGTAGVAVLAFSNGTKPSAVADECQIYSTDAAAGDHNLYIVNEVGEETRLTGRVAIVGTQFDKTSDTTLANVTGLTRNVKAGSTIKFRAVLETTSNVAGGVKVTVGGTATATSIVFSTLIFDGGMLAAQGRATALGGAGTGITAVTAATIVIEGIIVVNAAGTLTIQFAQNTSNGAASSVLVNSSFVIT